MSNKTRIIILTATVAVSTGEIIGLSAINPFARYAKVLEKGETTDLIHPYQTAERLLKLYGSINSAILGICR